MEGYHSSVRKWIEQHPGWQLRAGMEGFGWCARLADGSGPWIAASDLDELGELVEAERARLDD